MRYITEDIRLLKCLQSSLGFGFCLVEKVFRYLYMKVVAFWTDPGHLQFKFFLLCVIMHEVDAVEEVNNKGIGLR